MAEPTAEKHDDRLDRVEASVKLSLETIEHLVAAFEHENVSGERIKIIKKARTAIDGAKKKFGLAPKE